MSVLLTYLQTYAEEVWDAYSPRGTEAAQSRRANALRERQDAARAARAAEEALKMEAAAAHSNRGEQIRAKRVEFERRLWQACWLLHVALGARCGWWAHALTAQRPLRKLDKMARVIQALLLSPARSAHTNPKQPLTLSQTNPDPERHPGAVHPTSHPRGRRAPREGRVSPGANCASAPAAHPRPAQGQRGGDHRAAAALRRQAGSRVHCGAALYTATPCKSSPSPSPSSSPSLSPSPSPSPSP